MKLFRTSNIDIVRECQSLFGVDLSSIMLARRYIYCYYMVMSMYNVGLPPLVKYYVLHVSVFKYLLLLLSLLLFYCYLYATTNGK